MSNKGKGIAYGVGVGPGDPELMTLKACRLIRENSLIILPGREARESAAYKIAVRAVPELMHKQLIAVDMPMTKDAKLLEESHRNAADIIEAELDAGRNAVYLTLGDPAIYSSFSYIKSILESDGYETVMVSGIPSFCAAAARLGVSLAEGDEPVHVISSIKDIKELCGSDGSLVIMKSGRKMSFIKEALEDTGKETMAVENCGLDGEKVYRTVDDIPGDTGYFTVMIARDRKDKR